MCFLSLLFLLLSVSSISSLPPFCHSSKLHMDTCNSYSLYSSLISVLRVRLLTQFIHSPPNLPTPTQRHLIVQLANILHALGADAECACTGTSIAVPTSSGPAAAAPAAPAVSLQVPP
ncbi:hypothetical protein B0H19DRAFT_1156472, partial [Mycena capillaripes]